MKQVAVRRMNLGDVDGVLQVEVQSFPTPWSRQAFVDEMNHELSYYLVLVQAGQIIGYAGMWLIVDEAHITNVAVLPEYRGQKLGELLMSSMVEHAKNRGAASMTLEVRVSNDIAKGLYEKFGFKPNGLRKNYYADTKEDALVMWCKFT